MHRRTERDPRTAFLAGPHPAHATCGRTSLRLPRVTAALALVAALLAVVAFGSAPAGATASQTATTSPDAPNGFVSVIEVSGLLDRVLVDFIQTQLATAQHQGAISLVLQLNSKGAVVDRARLEALVHRIEASTVPVDVWVGPSGSRATGDATELLAAARSTGVAPGSRVEVTHALVGTRSLGGRAAIGDEVSAGQAVDLQLVHNAAPTIGEFILGLPGVQSKVVKDSKGRSERQPVTQARFGQLPLTSRLLHTVASPPVAYLLFVIGLALMLFELFTAGVGVAGLVGAGSLVLGCYGLAALPTNAWAVALLLLAIFGYGVDIQTGVPRVWSGIATVAFVIGSVTLYDGLSLSWVTLLVAIVGISLAMLGGMPAMVRVRFSTPTIGREWMVGEVGTARTKVSPDGVVTVREAPWRARTSRVTPIEAGQPVRVVSIDGLLLEVEPIEAEVDPAPGSH
jgi:membrane-bound serine protease (ClpP class)